MKILTSGLRLPTRPTLEDQKSWIPCRYQRKSAREVTNPSAKIRSLWFQYPILRTEVATNPNRLVDIFLGASALILSLLGSATFSPTSITETQALHQFKKCIRMRLCLEGRLDAVIFKKWSTEKARVKLVADTRLPWGRFYLKSRTTPGQIGQKSKARIRIAWREVVKQG